MICLLALVMTACLCAACGGSSGDGAAQNSQDTIFATLTDLNVNDSVLEMDGNSVPADMYLYFMVNMANSLEYNLSMSAAYGMYQDTVDEEGNIKWDQSLEGTPLVDIVRNQAENAALSYALLENAAKNHGVSVTAEDQAKLDEQLASQIEQSGGEEAFQQNLYEMGLTLDTFNRMRATDSLYQHLLELAKDPSSDIYVEESPEENNAYVDHILLMTVDSQTNEPLSEEEAAGKKAQAEDLLAQLQASDDLEKQFTEFAASYGEDPGRAAETGYLINPDTNFVQEFKDAAFALKPGEISGIVESSYGYHILLRKELTAEQVQTLEEQMADSHLGAYLDGQMAAAMENVTRSEKLDGINVGEFYESYIDAIQALHPQEDQSGADGGGDGGADGDTPAAG